LQTYIFICMLSDRNVESDRNVDLQKLVE